MYFLEGLEDTPFNFLYFFEIKYYLGSMKKLVNIVGKNFRYSTTGIKP